MKKERIVILTGRQKNKRFIIGEELTIGRHSDNTIQINNPAVSRHHAHIRRSPSGTYLRDLDSSNGTFIANIKIKKYQLKPRDEIQIANVIMRFEIVQKRPKKNIYGNMSIWEENEKVTLKTASTEQVYKTFLAPLDKSATIDDLSHAQARLSAVTEANRIICSEIKLEKLFQTILDQIFKLTSAHNGAILIADKATGNLQIESTKSRVKSKKQTISKTITNRTLKSGETILTLDAADDERFSDGKSIVVQNISSAMCVPLVFQKEKLGVIYVDTRGTKNAFKHEDLELLVGLSATASVAIKNSLYLQELEQAYHDTLVVTSNAIEMRDHYTVGHTWRVTNFALEIAKELNWKFKDLELCEKGGVLHDVGKIAVKDSILSKPTTLTEQEFKIMKLHPERGANMMKDVAYLKPLIPYCLNHHERWDGKGYPQGLKGKKIPIEGRIIAVADTFDAMTSKRPYKSVISPEKAIAEIKKNSGTQFDPKIVKVFIKCYQKGKIEPLLQDYYAREKNSIACPFCSTYSRFSSKAKSGNVLKCKVCHRHIKLETKGKKWFCELIPESEMISEFFDIKNLD
ncbi:MAG: HD domain-containing protein [Deltaproteobacteria bacterium]|jgi:putative nucleotidyltransferase with HDIG domain|nr:HD domain-containing protein [Deltaproteobacteria bacterium]